LEVDVSTDNDDCGDDDCYNRKTKRKRIRSWVHRRVKQGQTRLTVVFEDRDENDGPDDIRDRHYLLEGGSSRIQQCRIDEGEEDSDEGGGNGSREGDGTYHVPERFRKDVIYSIEVFPKDTHDTSEGNGVEERAGSEEDSMDGVLVQVPRGIEVEEGHGESENESHERLSDSKSCVDGHLAKEKAGRGQRESSSSD